tara:strand:+ start:186 stop:380 length:195 start_codon:yes stop_codon:yes gene_type:complete
MSKCLCPKAVRVAELLAPLATGRLPQEVLHLDGETTAIVVEICGTDYVLSMSELPRQRPRPATN